MLYGYEIEVSENSLHCRNKSVQYCCV